MVQCGLCLTESVAMMYLLAVIVSKWLCIEPLGVAVPFSQRNVAQFCKFNVV